METQKVVNFLNSSENEYLKFATKKWCVIDNGTLVKQGNYSHEIFNKFIRIKSL